MLIDCECQVAERSLVETAFITGQCGKESVCIIHWHEALCRLNKKVRHNLNVVSVSFITSVGIAL